MPVVGGIPIIPGERPVLVKCRQCDSAFEVEDRLVGTGRRKMRCSFCHAVFYVSGKPVEEEESGVTTRANEPPVELDGTMILSLFNRPKRPDPPPLEPPVRHADPDLSHDSSPSPVHAAAPEADAVAMRRVVVAPGRKAELIYKSRWLEEMEWQDVKTIAPYWELFRAQPGTPLFQPGDSTPFLVLVVQGEVCILGEDGDGGLETYATVQPGQSFGEACLLDNQPRVSRAEPVRESFLLILTRKRFDQLAKDHPALWRIMILRLARMALRRLRKINSGRMDFLS